MINMAQQQWLKQQGDVNALALAAVLRAPKLKSPLLGIPRPGSHPFVVSRDIVATCIKDGVVTDVVLNGTLQINVKRVRGKGSYKIMPHPRTSNVDTGVSRYDFRMYVVDPIHKWAAQQRRSGVLSGGGLSRSKYAVKIRDTKAAIAKLEARMNGTCHRYADRIAKPMRPINPVLREAEKWEQVDEHDRQRILAWYREKPQRKQISRIKAQHRQDKTCARLYKALAAAGYAIRPYTSVKRIRNRQVWPTSEHYIACIHEFCGLTLKPTRELEELEAEYGEDTKSHYDSKQAYVTQLREWQNAQQEIAMLRELLASYEQDAAQEAAST